MLSMSPVSGGSAASGYYKAEGYYLNGSQEAKDASRYVGEGARTEGLVGQIDDAKFTVLLEGITPAGTQIGRMRNGEWEHRPGLDLTFSAPKSASIAALVGGDKVVLDAHNTAVDAAIQYVEKNVVQTRQYKDGVLEKVTGGKLIGGAFQHDTSRAMDPHLHTHVVLANMVLSSDGRYRAIHNDELYKQTLIIGQVYRNAFAENLKSQGVNINYDTKTGFFELADVPKEVVANFSTRRNDIEASLAERGLEFTARNSQLAALATRATKTPVERSELYATWRAEAQKMGYEHVKATPLDHTERAGLTLSESAAGVADAVTFAVSHLSERNSVYDLKDTVLTAMRHTTGLSPVAIKNEIANRVSAGELFNINVLGRAHLTDQKTLETEHANISLMRSMKDKASIDVRLLSERLKMRTNAGAVNVRLAKTSLTEGQKEAVSTIVTGSDKVVGVQGLAGTGKTYMLETAARYLSKAGYEVEGLAPSHKAVSALDEAVPGSRTISSTLVRHANLPLEGDKTKTVLFVDEASMLSSQGMNSLLNMVLEKNYARIVLVGDVKQLDAVDAGPSFRQLQSNGMKTAQMTDIQRQNTDEGRAAVLKASAGLVREAMEGVRRIHETGGSRSSISDQISNLYLSRSPAERSGTGVIVSTNEMRTEVNQSIQSGLRVEGVLTGERQEVPVLVARNFTAAEASEVASYQVGDIVMSIRAIAKAGMEAGGLYSVVHVDPEARTLTIKSEESIESKLELKSQSAVGNKIAVFHESELGVYAGDEVKFRITDRENGILNANTGQLISVSDDTVSVRNSEGEIQKLPVDSLAVKGMELAYSATAHDFQGSTVDRVIMGMYSKEILANQKTFYVDLSRMKSDAELVTDDVGKLLNRLEQHTGERLLALEALAKNQPSDVAPERAHSEPAHSDPKGAQEASSVHDNMNDTVRENGPERPALTAHAEGQQSPSKSVQTGAHVGSDSTGKIHEEIGGNSERQRSLFDGNDERFKAVPDGAEIISKSNAEIDPKTDLEPTADEVREEVARLKAQAAELAKEAEAESEAIRDELQQLQRTEKVR